MWTRLNPMILLIAIAATPVRAAAGQDAGRAAFESGDYAAAARLFEAAIAADENDPVGHYYLGRIALVDDEADLAIDHLKRAVALAEDSSTYRSWLGRAYIAKLQTVSFFEKGVISGRALEQLEKAVELDPANIEARISLGGYYASAPSIAGGSRKKALEQAQEVIKYDPVQGNAMMASVHMKKGEFDQAIEKLEFCIDARPDNVDYRYQLGMIHQQEKRYDEAFAAFEAALDIDPGNRAVLYQVGRTAAFSGQNTARGIECLEKYLTLELAPGYPDYAGAHWRLGMIYEHRSDPERARDEYETAVRLDPGSDNYRDSLKNLDND